MGMFFGTTKPMVMSEFHRFLNLYPFCDVTDPQCYPKWPKIHLKQNKTQPNDCFDLKIGMGMFFGTTKPMVMSEFHRFLKS